MKRNPTATDVPTSRGLQRTATAGLLLVAAVAAAISYSHLRDLALAAGEGEWQAALLPLSVDGMLVVASMTAIARRRADRPPGLWARSGFLLGVAASIGANVAAAQPTAVGRLVAAWPPVALLLAWEMALGLTGTPHSTGLSRSAGTLGTADDRAAEPAGGPPAAHSSAGPAGPAQPGPDDGDRPSHDQPLRPDVGTPGGSPGQRSACLADVQAAIAALTGEDRPVNRRSITGHIRSSGLTLSNERADALLAEALLSTSAQDETER